MFHSRLVFTAALCLLAVAAAPLGAQNDPVPTFRSDSRLVVLHATVLDADGKLITDLPKSAFRVLENGVEQDLKVFRREDSPVSITFIVDDSGSMINKRQRVAAAAMALVQASHPDDEVSVLHFNEKTYLDTDFTHDRKALERGLNTFDSRGTTAMRDAVRLAISHMERKASEDKKVIVLITDGEDNSSRLSLKQVVTAAQQSGILMYTIGILNEVPDDETRRAQADLDALAKATGGQSYYLDNASEAAATAEVIAHDIRNQYTLAYTPKNEALDGTFRKIDLFVNSPAAVTVRTRSGYWAGGAPKSAMNVPPASHQQ